MTITAAASTALWLGILTAISPCPLTTNLAAISFIGGHTGHKNRVLLAGLLYSAGRTLAYILAGSNHHCRHAQQRRNIPLSAKIYE